ncbi:NfeD family protein [Shewanella sp. JM162201]|uniref:NfeD family protein n=1 Tax=Shewanella jiangmenensis TaxID=2837387 RepID=A0ABS5V2Z0_9GAMM|nr:NfeD family protein [Shewanella jiangmenensis]MBT1444049.1 NfeD family protein [Shewanella jiangmenensis]
MEFSNPVLVWGGVGVVLMLAEVIVPGGIVILLGAACLVVAGALWVGLVEGLPQAFTLWFISAMVLLLAFRSVTQRLVGGDSHVDNTDEALDIYNQLALVKADIGPGEKPGRVEFQGAEWPALGDGSLIASGAKVRVICRENISLIVENLGEK